MTNSFQHMQTALKLALQAASQQEVPIGCVIVDENNNILAQTHNLVETNSDATAHAELLAIKLAQIERKKQSPNSNRLENCSLYVTLEPCPMCAQAISFSRIKRVYFGAFDEKGGGVENGARVFNASSCHHKPEVYSGIMEDECKDILQKFFRGLRGDKTY